MKLIFNFEINDKLKREFLQYLTIEHINTDKSKYVRYINQVETKDPSEWSKGCKDELKVFLFQDKCGFNVYDGNTKTFLEFC